MYKGKLCASTTRYNDQTKGPCGCGATDPPPADQWTFTTYTAALNAANLEPENPSVAWCPTGCGSCYRVCSTGGKVQGEATEADVCRVFKISNRCGDGYDSNTPDWCSQRKSWQECAADSNACAAESSTNKYGYAAHFDLMDMHGQITTGLQWDNPEVTFEPVPCTEWEGPSWDCSCSSSEGNSTTVAPVDPTTQEPTSVPVDPTTVAPVDPTTQEPTPPEDEDGAYCPSAQDLVVAYGDGVELKDQGWTVNGGGGAATKAAYNLNGGYVEYDIDVSDAKAGTIPNVYSIAPSGLGADGFVKDKDYCDGADQHEYPWCVEVDWIESNGPCGGATTVHTLPGTGPGTCNAWGCRTEYHNDAPKIHMRIDYDDAGRMTVSRDGTPIDAMDPAPQPSDFDVIKKMHDSTGAVIYSSMWTGSWVPGPEDCGAGPGELTGSSFTVSNLRIHGSVVQGPEPQRCSTEEPTTVAPVDPTTLEPTTGPVDPTTQPTTAPVDPTTVEPTTVAPEETTTIAPEPTTDEPTTIAPVDPTTQEPTTAPVDPTTTIVPEPTTDEPTTMAPVDPTTQEPTTAPVDPTTIAPTTQPITEPESSTTSAIVTTTKPPAPTPSPQACHACLTVCAPCEECTQGKDGSFAFGSCEKCWHCWDWDDDELEDDDDDMDADCDAMHRKHDWNDDEVRCLTNDHQDCRACWASGLVAEMQVLV